MDRRDFLKFSVIGSGLLLSGKGYGLSSPLKNFYEAAPSSQLSKVEARYYEKLPDREIKCNLCPRFCQLGDKERGFCGVRENQEGKYYTLVYGQVASYNIDPIEKKPFFHFLPGSEAFSLATAGCNLSCKFCQNWEISQMRPEQVKSVYLPPEDVVQTAEQYRCPIIAYTYSEPVIFYEFMYDTSLQARRHHLRNVVVSAGFINPEPLADLIKVVDAIKIDLKAFTQDFYSNYVHGELQPVLQTIKQIAGSKAWLEIVYLVIPTLNDNPDDIRKMCRWLKAEIGPDYPLHFSRFHPMYLIKNLPPTPVSTLEKLRDIALEEGLHYVYVGNVPGHPGESTYCPNCGKLIIERYGYIIKKKEMSGNKCRYCGQVIPGVWS
ncbi:MAG: AmmeMemoRadiSam system radical SAM enzyme [Candidatus Aminicenantes bacterium]|jgi:Pyruvate-formate lyase-activating enzyme|nr:AmmeMemoRadiSam system radical SAM enzyme [Candidatus Aminicenantes bacterium]